jgi:DNA-directed RNA polymerase specialized sigma24 family protein
MRFGFRTISFTVKNTYKGINKGVVQQVQFYVRKLKTQKCFALDDVRDLEQELMLEVFSKIEQFVPAKGQLVTFVSAVLRRKSRSMTKIKTQKKRGKNYTFLPIGDDEIMDVSQSQELQNMAIDVSKVIETLPVAFKTLCETLKHHNVQETAKILGKSKSYVYCKIAVLRKLLTRFGDYLINDD